jgi:hypothetical protein
METKGDPLVEFNDDNPKPQMDSSHWNQIIKTFYNKYFTGEAHINAYEKCCIEKSEKTPKASPQLSNTLIQLQEFSTVVEANQAMKAGNIGSLLNIWKLWLVLSQGLKGLHNYLSYLPHTILLFDEVLNPSQSKLFRHLLLFSPSGKDNHYMFKDGYLKVQNYWLKHVYSQSGQGKQMDRLKDVFSLNIDLVSVFLSTCIA